MAKLNSFQSWSLTIIFYSFHIFWLEIYIFSMTWPWWKIHLFVIFIPTLRKTCSNSREFIFHRKRCGQNLKGVPLSLSLSTSPSYIEIRSFRTKSVEKKKITSCCTLRHTSSLSKTDRKNGRLARGKCCTVDSWKPQRVTGDASLLWGRFWFN